MEPADSDRCSLIVPEGGEQEQDWMWFAPFGDRRLLEKLEEIISHKKE